MDKKEYKIAFFGVKSWEKDIIAKEINKLPGFGIGLFEGEVQDNIEMAANYDVISLFIYSKISKEVLDKLPNLKMLATRSTGIDHIDSEECKKRNIKITSVPSYGSNTVAEYAFGLLLAITKKIVVAHQSVEEGVFSPEGLTGVDLFSKTLGVVGVGKIGLNVIAIAKGFGMNVLGVDAYPNEEMAKKLDFKYVDLETCLKESDFVTLHVPAIPETIHMINRQNIKLMKTGSYLVNTCRGPVVDAEALVWALNNKVLAGAAMDVFEEEDQVEDMGVVTGKQMTNEELKDLLSFHLLRDRDDVVFTPHNAFNTKEAIGRIVQTTVDNIDQFIKEQNN